MLDLLQGCVDAHVQVPHAARTAAPNWCRCRQGWPDTPLFLRSKPMASAKHALCGTPLLVSQHGKVDHTHIIWYVAPCIVLICAGTMIGYHDCLRSVSNNRAQFCASTLLMTWQK
jgi:hypothetical protein